MSKSTIKIGLMGAYRITDGYPNVKWLLNAMQNSQEVNIVYGRTKEAKRSGGIFNQSKKSKLNFILMITLMVSQSITSFSCCLYYYYRKRINLIYAPYPAHISLFFLSLIPKKMRPPVIVDGFISLYDSAVLDRKIFTEDSLLAKTLYQFEKRALSSSRLIIVDTNCSAMHISNLLNIKIDKFIHIPLMTDERSYIPSTYNKRKDNNINVVFIGTFVPLQGVTTIVKAANLLTEDINIYFTIVGTGQTAGLVKNELLKSKANVKWIKEWQSPKAIYNLIDSSDICLGIFGGSEKAARVWPLKNYANMCVGRAIISQDTNCIPYLTQAKEKPFISVPSEDANSLASSIKKLAYSYQSRKKYAERSKNYYQNYLSNDRIFKEYLKLLNHLK